MPMMICRANIRSLPKPDFISWLVSEPEIGIAGAAVKCFRLDWTLEETAFDRWAMHVRRHYVRDDELEARVGFFKLPVDSYLQQSVVPDTPQIRAGDFAEIVISDLLQFVEGYEVPRYKQHGRKDKNSSEHGTDIVAYRMSDAGGYSMGDKLLAVEVKSRCSSTDLKGGIKEAAHDSVKDRNRLAMTLDYLAACSLRDGDMQTAREIRRFLDAGEHPYELSLGVGVVAGVVDAGRQFAGLNADDLCLKTDQAVFVVHGSRLMELVHQVYGRCVR